MGYSEDREKIMNALAYQIAEQDFETAKAKFKSGKITEEEFGKAKEKFEAAQRTAQDITSDDYARLERLRAIALGHEEGVLGKSQEQGDVQELFARRAIKNYYSHITSTTSLEAEAMRAVQDDNPRTANIGLLAALEELSKRGEFVLCNDVITEYNKNHPFKFNTHAYVRTADLIGSISEPQMKALAKAMRKENAAYTNGKLPSEVNSFDMVTYITGEYHDETGKVIIDENGNPWKAKNNHAEITSTIDQGNAQRETFMVDDKLIRYAVFSELGPITQGEDNTERIKRIKELKIKLSESRLTKDVGATTKMENDGDPMRAFAESRFGKKLDPKTHQYRRSETIIRDDEYAMLTPTERAMLDEAYEKSADLFMKALPVKLWETQKGTINKSLEQCVESKLIREGKPHGKDAIHSYMRQCIPLETLAAGQKAAEEGRLIEAKPVFYDIFGIPKPKTKTKSNNTGTNPPATTITRNSNPGIQVAIEEITRTYNDLPPRNQISLPGEEQITNLYDDFRRIIINNIPDASITIHNLDSDVVNKHFNAVNELYDYIIKKLQDLL